MDLSKTSWPKIVQAISESDNSLECQVNNVAGTLSFREEKIRSSYGDQNVWVISFNGFELIRVSKESSQRSYPETSGIRIELAEG